MNAKSFYTEENPFLQQSDESLQQLNDSAITLGQTNSKNKTFRIKTVNKLPVNVKNLDSEIFIPDGPKAEKYHSRALSNFTFSMNPSKRSTLAAYSPKFTVSPKFAASPTFAGNQKLTKLQNTRYSNFNE